MSLINVAQQVRGPRTLTHTVLAVIAVAVGMGLLHERVTVSVRPP